MIIKVRLIPGADRNEVISRIGSVLRVKIKTKKVDDGPANAMMKTFLSDFFNVKEGGQVITTNTQNHLLWKNLTHQIQIKKIRTFQKMLMLQQV